MKVYMIKATMNFPVGFLWGTATSSHQVEGGNTLNDWWAWESEPGRILAGHRSDKACDWWGGRWKEDLDLAADSGQNAHRLSIEWSRVEPSHALWDESAIDFYRELIQGALDRGMMPLVTLHHFTSPIWVSERGGWLNPDIVNLFSRYVRKIVSALEDLVGIWVTINEPNVLLYEGYGEGKFPPGGGNLLNLPKAAKHMVLAHSAAYHAIHEIQPGSLVGLAHNYRGFWPASPRNPLDRWMARFRSRLFNDLFPRALKDGKIRFLSRRDRIPEAKGTQDYFGLNYYTVEQFAFNPFRPSALFHAGGLPPETDASPSGFIANEPAGMWESLRWAHSYDLPIYITENGIEDREDRIRPRYLLSHLRQVWRAVARNWQVQGYFHWTLVDNFEWDRGWTQRFGLWELDRKTQQRRKRPSADLYAEICRSNTISSEMTARYAPEVLDALFPPRGSLEMVLPNG